MGSQIRAGRHRMRGLCVLIAGGMMLGLSGCSLFVMAGKMLAGDPKIPSAFEQVSRVNLTKGKKKVLVICSTPEYIKADYPSLNFDLTDGVIRRMRLRGIEVISPDLVTTWIDNQGGFTQYDANELAQEFDADYIVHVDIDRFDYKEENSVALFRGRMNGHVYGYEVRKTGGMKMAQSVFAREITSVYPTHHPVSSNEMSAGTFRKRYLDIAANEVARLFYDHRLSETF
jgi:hypothetical protein